MDTCDSDSDHILYRCFGGMKYATNCNLVLNVPEFSAKCYDGLGVRGASICDLVSNHNGTSTQSSQGSSCTAVPTSSSLAAEEWSPTTEASYSTAVKDGCPTFIYNGVNVIYTGPGSSDKCRALAGKA